MEILAIVGWGLFVFVAILYYVGNKINSRETNALASYSLALILSDDFREPTRSGIERAIREAPSTGLTSQELTYRLMIGVTNNAKKAYVSDGSRPATLYIVTKAIEKLIE